MGMKSNFFSLVILEIMNPSAFTQRERLRPPPKASGETLAFHTFLLLLFCC